MNIVLRGYLGFLLQILPCAFYCFYPFRTKLRYPLKEIVVIVLTITLIMASIGVWSYTTIEALPFALDAYLIVDIIFFLTLTILFIVYLFMVRANFYQKLFIFFLNMNYGFLIEVVMRIVSTYFGLADTSETLYPTVFIIYYVIANTIMVFPMIWFLNSIQYMFEKNYNERLWGQICLIPLFFIIFVTIIYDIPYIVGHEFLNYLSLVIIPVVIFFFILLIWLFKILHLDQIRSEKQTKLEFMVRNYQDRINNIKKLKEIRHEIKHTITALNYLLNNQDYEGAKRYLEKYSISMDKILLEDYSDNALLNSLLSDYKNRFEQENVDFDININVASNFTMDDMDLVELLTNMLDNALEACRLDRRKDRSVLLNIDQNAHFILFECKNTYNQSNLLKVNNQLASNKQNTNFDHGYGVQVMKHIAEKYNGLLRISADDELFTLSVHMCIN